MKNLSHDDLVSRCQDLEEQLHHSSSLLSGLEADREKLTAELQVLRPLPDKVEKQREELRIKKKELQTLAKSVERDKQRLEEARARAKEVLSELKTGQDKCAEVSEKYRVVVQSEEELRKRLELLAAENTSLKKTSEDLSLKLQSEQEEYSVSKVTKLQTQVSDLKKKVEGLKTECAQKEQELKDSTRQLGSAMDDIAALKQQALTVKEKVQRSSGEKKTALKLHKNDKIVIEKMKKELASADNRLREKDTEIGELSEQLKTSTADRHQAISDKSEIELKFQMQQDESRSLKTQLTTTKLDLVQLEEKKQESERLLSVVQAENSQLKEHEGQQLIKVERLTQELTDIKDKVSALRQDAHQMVQDIVHSQEECQDDQSPPGSQSTGADAKLSDILVEIHSEDPVEFSKLIMAKVQDSWEQTHRLYKTSRERIAELSQNLTAQTATELHLRNQISEMENDVTKREKEIQELKEKNAADNDKCHDQLGDLKKLSEQQQKEILQHKKDLDQRIRESNELLKELQVYKTQNEALQDAMNEAPSKADFDCLHKEHETLQVEIASLKTGIMRGESQSHVDPEVMQQARELTVVSGGERTEGLDEVDPATSDQYATEFVTLHTGSLSKEPVKEEHAVCITAYQQDAEQASQPSSHSSNITEEAYLQLLGKYDSLCLEMAQLRSTLASGGVVSLKRANGGERLKDKLEDELQKSITEVKTLKKKLSEAERLHQQEREEYHVREQGFEQLITMLKDGRKKCEESLKRNKEEMVTMLERARLDALAALPAQSDSIRDAVLQMSEADRQCLDLQDALRLKEEELKLEHLRAEQFLKQCQVQAEDICQLQARIDAFKQWEEEASAERKQTMGLLAEWKLNEDLDTIRFTGIHQQPMARNSKRAITNANSISTVGQNDKIQKNAGKDHMASYVSQNNTAHNNPVFKLGMEQQVADNILPIRSGLVADEDGHKALELKHFQMVEEIIALRQELQGLKRAHTQEVDDLQRALMVARNHAEMQSDCQKTSTATGTQGQNLGTPRHVKPLQEGHQLHGCPNCELTEIPSVTALQKEIQHLWDVNASLEQRLVEEKQAQRQRFHEAEVLDIELLREQLILERQIRDYEELRQLVRRRDQLALALGASQNSLEQACLPSTEASVPPIISTAKGSDINALSLQNEMRDVNSKLDLIVTGKQPTASLVSDELKKRQDFILGNGLRVFPEDIEAGTPVVPAVPSTVRLQCGCLMDIASQTVTVASCVYHATVEALRIEILLV